MDRRRRYSARHRAVRQARGTVPRLRGRAVLRRQDRTAQHQDHRRLAETGSNTWHARPPSRREGGLCLLHVRH